LAGISELVKRVAVDKYQRDRDMLIQILLDLQSGLGWLPAEVLTEVSRQLRVPIARVYQVASFYKAFSFSPRGRHTVTVCLGTACQVRGAPRLLDRTTDKLKLAPGETSADMRFSLDTVNCLGCCALGPVIVIDGKYHSKPSTSELEHLFDAAK
jgi:NADH-quinone oxidoreductase subunit E